MDMSEQNRKAPNGIIVIAVIASIFGLVSAAIIVSSRGTQQDNPVIVLPTVNVRRLGVDVPAPDFTLNTLDGKPVSLKDLRGKPVLINFWASWCPPCLQETPDLVAAYQELGASKVTFVGIGTQDDTDKLLKLSTDNKVPYIIVEDPRGKAGDAYAVIALPMTILVDSNGTVRKVFTGPVTKEQVITEMGKLE
jgi:peroxiredoxin